MEASDLHPSKRLRSQSPSPSPPPSAKGKEKIEDVASDSDSDGEPVCGICLSEGGRAVRGRIDICDHFFCFVCIMEWARIESRCPTCKQRFRSIRRPRIPGLFACERVVNVPHRDQVYHPLGNESTALSDPYEHTNCNTCNSSSNENLLLLCDLCDSAAHTYCVGLGFTVPEGDWYCSDCAISRDEHLKTQSDADCCNEDSYEHLRSVRKSGPPVSPSGIMSVGVTSSTSSQSISNFSRIQVPEEHRVNGKPFRNTSRTTDQDVIFTEECSTSPTTAGDSRSFTDPPDGVPSVLAVSIFEIVSDEQRNVERRSTGRTSQRVSQDLVLHNGRRSFPTVPVERTAPSTRAEGGPRTLSRCRTLHGRIRELRENWNALRAGSVAFRSGVPNGSGTTCGRKQKKCVVHSNVPRLPDTTSVVKASTEKHNTGGSVDVSRAWKMMEIAKSIQPSKRSTTSNPCVNSQSKKNVSADKFQSSSFVSKDSLSVHKVTGNCKSQNNEKPRLDKKTTEMQQIRSANGKTFLSGYSEPASNRQDSEPSSSKQDTFPLKDKERNGLEEPASQHILVRDLVSFDKCRTHIYPISSASSLPEVSSLSCAKSIHFECSKVEPPKSNQGEVIGNDGRSSIHRNVVLNNKTKSRDAASEGKSRAVDNTAKEEVQSLVKLNLKLLNRERRLDEAYISFHDECWGVPVYNDSRLFEMLVLSGMLIDLNWAEILKRRELYREVFADFDHNVVAKMEEKDIIEISSNKELMLAECRARCIVENARCMKEVAQEFGSFSEYIWGHMNHKPMVNRYKYPKSVPLRTPKAEAISRDLVRRGFRLVGPVIVYSFMQASGMAIDHLVDCFRFRECVRLAKKSWGMSNMAM